MPRKTRSVCTGFESHPLRHAPYGAWLRPVLMKYFYVYILRSRLDKRLYIGFTEDVFKRLQQHNDGNVQSTKPRRPFDLIFFEAYVNKYDALRREKYFKTAKGKTTVRSMLKEYLSSSNS